MVSKKYTLNKQDLTKIATGAGIAAAGTLITYLAELIPSVDFGQYDAIVSMILMILINTAKKYLAGK